MLSLGEQLRTPFEELDCTLGNGSAKCDAFRQDGGAKPC